MLGRSQLFLRLTSLSSSLSLCACQPREPAATAPTAANSAALSATAEAAGAASAIPGATVAAPQPAPPSAVLATATCTPANWDAQKLPLLLEASKNPKRPVADQLGVSELLFDATCSDNPKGPPPGTPPPLTLNGVEVRLTQAAAAGATGRGWVGNQCAFELRAADGSGQPVTLGPAQVPPFNVVTALLRSGSAVWLSVGFNGYAREFPAGGNRVIAADLCSGRVVWQSLNATSNGGLLLLGDYLISPYGFTSEPRFVYVLDARSGNVVQKLPVLENVCPSESWRPHWRPGERCDAPGQRVGAATNPRVSGNLLLVDTNTGSSTFAFR